MKDKEKTSEEKKFIEFFTSPEHIKLIRELMKMKTDEDRQRFAEFERQLARNLGIPLPSYLKEGKLSKD